MAEKKDKMMQDFLSKEWKVGDKGIIKRSVLDETARNQDAIEYVIIKEILSKDKFVVKWITEDGFYMNKDYVVDSYNITALTLYVGANPFVEQPWNKNIKTYNHTLGNIFSIIGQNIYNIEECPFDACDIIDGVKVKELNFNPYVVSNNEKLYYQRDFCWSLEDKQMLIESIYNYINCGMLCLRKRSFNYLEGEIKKGNQEIGFWDVVDGKQRLGCLIEFIHDKFQDLHGNYFSDLSEYSKRLFRNSKCFTFSEMGEGTTDEEVIESFLHINYTGKQISQEHIDYVKQISNKLKNEQ